MAFFAAPLKFSTYVAVGPFFLPDVSSDQGPSSSVFDGHRDVRSRGRHLVPWSPFFSVPFRQPGLLRLFRALAHGFPQFLFFFFPTRTILSLISPLFFFFLFCRWFFSKLFFRNQPRPFLWFGCSNSSSSPTPAKWFTRDLGPGAWNETVVFFALTYPPTVLPNLIVGRFSLPGLLYIFSFPLPVGPIVFQVFTSLTRKMFVFSDLPHSKFLILLQFDFLTLQAFFSIPLTGLCLPQQSSPHPPSFP